jgi:hypothetical protein
MNYVPSRQEIYRTLEQTQKRRQEESDWWKKLRDLANKELVAEFYEEYAKYLEWNNIISEDRKVIYKMAIKAAELLKQ